LSVDWIGLRCFIGLNFAAIFLPVLSSLSTRTGAGGVSGMSPLVQYTCLDLLFNWEKDKYKHLLFDGVGDNDKPFSISLIEVVSSVGGVEGVRSAPHVLTRSVSKSR